MTTKRYPKEIYYLLADELEKCAQISADLDLRMQNVRSSIFTEVYPVKYDNLPEIPPRFNMLPNIPLIGE